ncbi:hypothetical protein WP50_18030, partial [Lactiplantibacillus plantarum]
MGIKIRTDAIYDVQIKRLHAYKRQLLHVFEILREYFAIKDHPQQPVVPRVHIFGAKAAPSYHYAKAIIKLINVVADMVNQDPAIGDRLDQTIGSDWRRQPDLLQTLLPYQQDDHFLYQLGQVKLTNKQALAAYVQRTMGIKIRTDAIYDVQIKRLHAYKRQLLHVFEILREYFAIKDHPHHPVVPRVPIFGAKAAPSYHYAKAIIKLINVVADMVNQDPAIGDRLDQT